MRILASLLVYASFYCSALSQTIFIGGTSSGCVSPPFALDFASTYTSGVLDGQDYWDDLGDGNNFTAVAGTGVRGTEDGWGVLQAARRTTHCELSTNKQFAYFIYQDITGSSNGENYGAGLRITNAGDTVVAATYDENGGAVRLLYRFGTSGGQIGWSAQTLVTGDSISIYCEGDSVFVEKNGTPIINEPDYASMPLTGKNIGLVCSGGSTDWAIIRFGGGNW